MSDLSALHVRGTLGVARMAASAGLMAVVMPEEIAEATNLNRHKEEPNKTRHATTTSRPVYMLLSNFNPNPASDGRPR